MSKNQIAEGAVTAAQRSIDSLTIKIDTNDASTLQKRMDNISRDKTSQRIMLRNLEEKKSELINSRDWQPKYLNKYVGREESDFLVKKVIVTFSYLNPELNTRQERTEIFLLSKHGQEVWGLIYKREVEKEAIINVMSFQLANVSC